MYLVLFNKGLKSTLDYLVVRQWRDVKVKDIRVKLRVTGKQGHHLIVTRWRFFMEKLKRTQETYVKFKLESIQDESTKYLYKRRLSLKLSLKNRTVKEKYGQIKECVFTLVYNTSTKRRTRKI